MGSSGGGSSPPAETKTTQVMELPAYVEPYAKQMMKDAGQLASNPYEQYPYQRIAGLTPQHYAGLDMTTQRAINGSPIVNEAQKHATNVFDDTYMNKGLDLAGQQNPYQGQANPYSGSNQYMEGMIDKGASNITDHYNDVVIPQLGAMDRNSGAYGNSGVQATRANAQEQLLEQLSNNENQFRFQDYGQQAQLAETGLNRNAQLAGQQQLNTLGTYGNERANQMGTMEFSGALADQDYKDMQNLLGVGDIYRNVEQQQLDNQYNDWTQYQNWPYQQLDVLQNAIGTNLGSNTSNISSAPNAYAQSNTAQNIGMGLAGFGSIQGLLGN